MLNDPKTQPFSEHISELRKRLLFVITLVIVGCGFGYAVHEPLFRVLKRPLDQELYYNSPIGGFNAMLKISILVGLIISIPFLIYQICRFITPAFEKLSAKRPIKILVWSVLLAATGVAFGYFISLPSALKFLTNYDSQNIQPLIIVGEYLNFVFSYLLGFAVLFQLPLVLLFANHIKPQNPRHLIKQQRWVILFSFIIAAILTPTPDPINQFIMAAPVIFLYQVSVGLVWIKNRRLKLDEKPLSMIEEMTSSEYVNDEQLAEQIPTEARLTFMDIMPPQET